MKAIVVIAILFAIGLIILLYKHNRNIKKLLISSAILGFIITTAILGNVMRSITPLFLTHIGAVIIAYLGLILYIIREKNYWYAWFLPLFSLLFYLLLAYLSDEHKNIKLFF